MSTLIVDAIQNNAGFTPFQLTEAGSQSTSSGTEFEWTGLPTTVKHMVVDFNNVSLSGTDDIQIQIGETGGYKTADYVSECARVAAASQTLVSQTTGFLVDMTAASETFSGHYILTMSDTNIWAASMVGRFSTTMAGFAGGRADLGAQLDRIKVLATGANTFDSGVVNMFYL